MTVNKEKISCCVSSSHMITRFFLGTNTNDSAGSSISTNRVIWRAVIHVPGNVPQPQISGFHWFFKKYFELWENCYKVFQRLNRLEQNPGIKTGLGSFNWSEIEKEVKCPAWNNSRKHRGLIWGWGREECTIHTWGYIAHFSGLE